MDMGNGGRARETRLRVFVAFCMGVALGLGVTAAHVLLPHSTFAGP